MTRAMPILLTLLLLLAAPSRAVPPAAGPDDAPVTWIDTADGAEVAVQHLATPGGPAVVLCHGISSNHAFWNLMPGRSLARFLQARGYDVYNLDLRGHGFAVRDRDGHRQHAGWSVDDYGRYDLPAVFDRVRAWTGQDEVSYVGHSLGGMVLAVYLATHPDPGLHSAVVVASPLDFRDPSVVTRALLRHAWIGRILPFLPTPAGASLLAVLGDRAPLHLDDLLFNPADIADPAVRKVMLRQVVSPLSRGEARQLGLAAKGGEFRSADGTVAYRKALGDVQVPMLFFAGRADRVVNPDRVRAYYEAVESPHKKLVVASVANGFAADYGHLDYGDGDHAQDEVFPRIAAWLDRWR